MRSPFTTGVFRVAATHSLESLCCVERSPWMKLIRAAPASFGACCGCPWFCGYCPGAGGYCAWEEYCGGISSGCCESRCASATAPNPRNMAPVKKIVVKPVKKLFMAVLLQQYLAGIYSHAC